MADKEQKQEKTWLPSLKWLCKYFFIIAVVVVVTFFILNFLLKPYMRDIPSEITPWLDKGTETQSIQQEQSK
jgi:hypothetical protein